MLSIITSRTRKQTTRRPTGPVAIHKSSRQFHGLIAWWPAAYQGRECINFAKVKDNLANNGVTVAEDRIFGNVWNFAPASSQYFGSSSPVTESRPMSVAAWVRTNAIGASGQTVLNIQWSGGALNRNGWNLNIAPTGGSGKVQWRSNSTTTSRVAQSSTSVVAKEWAHMCGVEFAVDNRAAYLNAAGKGTNAQDGSHDVGLDQTAIGRFGGIENSQYFDGMIADVRIYNRALSDSDVYNLYDPDTRWDLYYPIGRVSYFFLSGVQAFSLDASPGSYTLTGADSGLVAARVIDGASGTYVLSGSDAGLIHGYMINAETGGYAITGADAGVLAARMIDAATGSYVITGADAGLIAARMIDAGAGAYLLTGADAGVLAARILDASPGSYAIVGVDATLVYTPTGAFAIDAEPGVYQLTGAVAGLIADRLLNAEPSSYLISGAAAGVLADRIIDASPGVYTISGLDAGVIASRLIDAQPGIYQITGFDADLVLTLPPGAFVINAESGVYVITGLDAGLIAPVALSPGDLVQAVIAGGIECTVLAHSGTDVKVVISSEKKITVLTEGGTPIKVII